jgi:hypothetical protein
MAVNAITTPRPSPSQKSRWEFTSREEQIAAKWLKPHAVYGDVVMYQTLLQLLYLASILFGLLTVACVLAYITDCVMWMTEQPPYFKIDTDMVFNFIWLPSMGIIILEGFFTTQIAKLKYIGKLQEHCFGHADLSHD